jgi:hypothetical protein
MAQATPWDRLVVDKFTVAQLVNHYPTLYETPIFVALFTTDCHWFVL